MGHDEVIAPPIEDILKLFSTLQTAIDATAASAQPLLTRALDIDPSFDFSSGLSLLLVRPQLLLASLHHLVVLIGLRLSSKAPQEPNALSSSAFKTNFAAVSRSRPVLKQVNDAADELAGELRMIQEVAEKVRGLEAKLDYQIKKLVGLAQSAEAKGKDIVEDVTEDPLSFRPNPSAIMSASQVSSSLPRRTGDTYARDTDGESTIHGAYRPPRVAAVPYNEPTTKARRTDRRAPALLSEFASTMDGAPMLESTSGLSTRPVQASRHTNSASAKRAEELDRINQFEEENMTRLVTSKREAKRRKEDEAALALGYGVGGTSRSRGRKQNGLEAELEGVLGDRGSRGLWEGAGSKLGKRDGVLEHGNNMNGESRAPIRKKARFAREVSSARSKGSKRTRA